jgi:hypothetical protein
MPKDLVTSDNSDSIWFLVTDDSIWSLMKKRPVSSEVNWCDSVMFPLALTIAPEIAWTMPGLSLQTRVNTQWVSSEVITSILIREDAVFALLPSNAYGNADCSSSPEDNHGRANY